MVIANKIEMMGLFSTYTSRTENVKYNVLRVALFGFVLIIWELAG